MKIFLGDKANVTHATGCKIAHNDTGVSYDNWRYIEDIQYASLDDNRPLIAEAVVMAKNSDLVILALGHGLSYTKFSYGNPQPSANRIRSGESVTVSFDVTNTGSKAGTEVVQVYVTGEEFEIARPRLELKGFARIAMNPGETQKAEIQIAAKDLEFHSQKLERVLPRGKYQIRVGGSSEALGSPVTLDTVPAAQ